MSYNYLPEPDRGYEDFIEKLHHFIASDLFVGIGPKAKLSYLYTMLYRPGGLTEKLEGLLTFKLKANTKNKLLDLLHKSPLEQWNGQFQVVRAIENLLADTAIQVKASVPELLSIQQQQEIVSKQGAQTECQYHLQFHVPLKNSHLQTFQHELETLYHILKDLEYLVQDNLSTKWLDFDPIKVNVLDINLATQLSIAEKFRPLNPTQHHYHADFVGKKWILELLNTVFNVALQNAQHKTQKRLPINHFKDIAVKLQALQLLHDQHQKLSKIFLNSVFQLQLAIQATKMNQLPLIQEISL